jgi:hypothetical protein
MNVTSNGETSSSILNNAELELSKVSVNTNVEIVFNIALKNPEPVNNFFVKSITNLDSSVGVFNVKVYRNTTYKVNYVNNNYVENNLYSDINLTRQQFGGSNTDMEISQQIPNISFDTINHIIKCKLTFDITYSKDGINGFKITGLQKAIDSLGKLV